MCLFFAVVFFLTITTVEKFIENCFIESCFYLDVDFHFFVVMRYSLPSKDSLLKLYSGTPV